MLGLLGIVAASQILLQSQAFRFNAGPLAMDVDSTGSITAMVLDGESLVPAGQPSPLLQLRFGGSLHRPQSAGWNSKSKTLTLRFDDHEAKVRVLEKAHHLTLDLVQVKPSQDVDVAVWGPYATTLSESIGETIGVVQGKNLAVGLQVLNAKTLGGFPNTEDDVEPSYSIFDSKDVSDLKASDADKELYRGDTAKAIPHGSVIQAYARNRSTSRVIDNWQHPFYTAPPFKDGGVVGSKVALFGCHQDHALATIGEIEVAEGLPHPMLDGVWGKISPTATEAYLIMGFNTQNLDECLAVTKKAGLRYLYTDSCFKTWGHFELDPKGFPKGWESMKECVDRAAAQGIRLGVHTLSNFITTNDPYVTPVPDKRLAEVGASIITSDVDVSQTEIPIESAQFFDEMVNNNLRTVRVGDELVQYDSVSQVGGPHLTKCKRGAFGTKSVAHKKGARIAKLMDHGYGVFLTNADLSQEVARNIAKLFNATGLRQLSMDGLEGNWSTGMGQYGKALFAKTWYDSLSPALKGEVINDASTPSAFNWHINTRENWGEPWYAGFRKSQTQYRLKNQHYFKRNLMPAMLGWFSMSSETTPEDMQWLLARAAGFDAGFCITSSLDAIKENPNSDQILESVKAWESARHAGVFDASTKVELQDISKEFERLTWTNHGWFISPVRSQKFSLTSDAKTFIIDKSPKSFAERLILQVPAKCTLKGLTLALNGKPMTLSLPGEIVGPRYLSFSLDGLHPGKNTLSYGGTVIGSKGTEIEGEIRQDEGVQATRTS